MICSRCQANVDGSDYPHWQKVCWPCKATLDAREEVDRLEKENRELRTKQQLFVSSNWGINCSQSVAEIENEELRAQLAAANERAEKAEQSFRGVSEAVSISGPWACFHCGFITGDEAEAKVHFGDRYNDEPLCLTWHDLDADGRASEYQSVLKELGGEREENDALRTKIEGLEYRVDGQLSNIRSFAPFRKCSGINEVFHVYDSMEGRALAAEAERDALAARVAELEGATSVPPELLAHMLKLGPVEWGSVPARSDEQHVSDFRDTLAITRETFGTVGDVPLDGVYLQGTATVVCHTGTSPNSPMTARIVAGLWNHFLRTQSALARTPAQSLAACKAAALREVAKEMQEVTDSIVWCEAELQGRQAIIDRVSEMADRLEAEAANG